MIEVFFSEKKKKNQLYMIASRKRKTILEQNQKKRTIMNYIKKQRLDRLSFYELFSLGNNF